jgi:hypothetical protein
VAREPVDLPFEALDAAVLGVDVALLGLDLGEQEDG